MLLAGSTAEKNIFIKQHFVKNEFGSIKPG
jgi:hypothetical protein